MKVSEFIEQLQSFPQDMDIVVVGDYIYPPSIQINSYTHGERDSNDNLIIKERVEIH